MRARKSPVEQLVQDVISIDQRPDWPPIERLAHDGQRIVEESRAAALMLIKGSGNPGFAMRGITLAMAEVFDTEDLERGMASTIRGVRNAFAQEHDARKVRF